MEITTFCWTRAVSPSGAFLDLTHSSIPRGTSKRRRPVCPVVSSRFGSKESISGRSEDGFWFCVCHIMLAVASWNYSCFTEGAPRPPPAPGAFLSGVGNRWSRAQILLSRLILILAFVPRRWASSSLSHVFGMPLLMGFKPRYLTGGLGFSGWRDTLVSLAKWRYCKPSTGHEERLLSHTGRIVSPPNWVCGLTWDSYFFICVSLLVNTHRIQYKTM